MSRPLVGITTRRIAATALGAVPAGVIDAPLEGVFAEYAESVAGAGGLPVLIARSADVDELVGRLDGLVLSGGEDVEPLRYGALPGPEATSHDPERDEFEISLVVAAVAAQLPILAICRGVQVLNVALGGTLVEHLSTEGGFDHSTTDEHRSAPRHVVTLESGCLLAEALAVVAEDGAVRVNSYHHQAVDRPAPGLSVVARAHDGTIEAVEDRERRVLGVQWHPEMHAGVDPIFTWFIQQIRDEKRGTP